MYCTDYSSFYSDKSLEKMTTNLPLLREKSISLEDALTDDDNIRHRLDYPQQKKEFWSYLLSYRNEIEELASFHLCAKHCQVAHESDWLFGSYNVCIPVYVNPAIRANGHFSNPLTV